MKFWGPFQLQSIGTPDDLRRFVNQAITNLSQIVTNNINFQDNMNCQVVGVTLGTSEIAIKHNFNRVPFGYLVLNQDANATIYSGTTEWNANTIYLKASGTVYAKIGILGG